MIDYIYRVRTSDTIDSIAETFDISVNEILRYNNITKIREGDRLVIMKKPQQTHMVKANETLSDIARQYGVTVEDLKKLNEVEYIYTGLNLVVKR